MKRLGLTPLSLSATLFLALQVARLPAQDNVGSTAANPPKPEGVQQLQELMRRFDLDGDGNLDDDERAAARKMAAERGLGPGGDARAELLKRFDTNGNGRIDEDERAAMPEMVKRRIAKGAGFAKPNRETAKKEEPLENVLRAAVAGNPALLKKFDDDKDGALNDREWAVARKTMAEALGGK